MADFNRRAYTANRITINFDHQNVVGAIQNANVNIDYRLDAVSGIGNILPYEWIPTMLTVTVDCDVAYLFGHELERVGAKGTATGNPLVPSNGVGALKGVVFDISAEVFEDDTIINKSIGQSPDAANPTALSGPSQGHLSTLWTALHCNMNTGSFRLAKHGMVIRNGSFNALDFAIGQQTADTQATTPTAN